MEKNRKIEEDKVVCRGYTENYPCENQISLPNLLCTWCKGRQFELKVIEKLQDLPSANVIHNINKDGDQCDIFLNFLSPIGEIKCYIECKNYNRDVGIDVVNKFYNTFNTHRFLGNADKGVIISALGFTENANTKADRLGIVTLPFHQFVRLIENTREYIGLLEKTHPLPVPPPNPYYPHTYSIQKKFTGREETRAIMTSWYQSSSEPIFCLRAAGGIGKSALAWVWTQHDIYGNEIIGLNMSSRETTCCLSDEANRPDGFIWWSFYEQKATFSEFLRKAGEYVFADNLGYREAGTKDKIDMLYEFLSSRRFLIVFDGFERALRAYMKFSESYKETDAEIDVENREAIEIELDTFLKKMCSTNTTSRLLITTRQHPSILDDRLTDETDFELKSMSKKDAVAFFKKYKIVNTRAEIETLCEKYNYIPLCLRILVGAVAVKPKYKKDIKNLQKDIDLIKLARNRDDKHKIDNILLFSQELLNEERQQLKNLMYLISAFRAKVDYDTIKKLVQEDAKGSIDSDLEDLVERGLLFYDEKTYEYTQHPEVKKHYYSQIPEVKTLHEQIMKYYRKLDERSLPSILSVLKEGELDEIIHQRDALAQNLHPEETTRHKTIRGHLQNRKITDRVPLLDMILKYIIGQKDADSVGIHITKYLASLGDDIPKVTDVLGEDTIKEFIDFRDQIAKDVLDKDFAKKQREANLFPEKNVGIDTLEEYLQKININERVWLLEQLFRDDEGRSIDMLLVFAFKHLKSLGKKCPKLKDIFEQKWFDGIAELRDKLVEMKKEGKIKINDDILFPERKSKRKKLQIYLKSLKIIDSVPVIDAIFELRDIKVDLVAKHIRIFFEQFPEKLPTFAEVIGPEKIPEIITVRNKMAEEMNEDQFRINITKDDLYPEKKAMLENLEELLRQTKITERLRVLDMILPIIEKKQDEDSFDILTDKYLESLGNEIPSIASVLSPEELKVLRESQEQLEKILFPEKDAGFNTLEELLQNTSVNGNNKLLAMVFGEDSRQAHLQRISVKSLDDLSLAIELYHHTVHAGRYDEAWRLFHDRLTHVLYFQIGAYQTIIELLGVFFNISKDLKMIGNEMDKAIINNVISLAYSLSGQPKLSIQFHFQYIEISETQDRKGEVAKGLGNLAYQQTAIADLQSAESTLRRRIKLAKEIKEGTKEAIGHHEIGRVYAYIGDFDKSKIELNAAMNHFMSRTNPQGQCQTWFYHSIRALLMNDPAAALEAANKSWDIARQKEKEGEPIANDLIWSSWLMGSSYYFVV